MTAFCWLVRSDSRETSKETVPLPNSMLVRRKMPAAADVDSPSSDDANTPPSLMLSEESRQSNSALSRDVLPFTTSLSLQGFLEHKSRLG